MADGGIGESALLSAALEGAGTGAAIGGGLSLLTGRDPLQGALMGGLTGGVFGGAGNLFADSAGNVIDASTDTLVSPGSGTQAPVYDSTGVTTSSIPNPTANIGTPLQSMNAPAFDPYADLGAGTGVSSGMPFQTGGENVLQNQLGGAAASTEPVLATGQGAAGESLVSSPVAGAVPTGAGATAAATGNGGIAGLANNAADWVSSHPYLTAGGIGAAYLMNQERKKYGVPATEKYSGPLSKFSYDPLTYKPDVVSPPSPLYRAQYATGGPVEQMTNNNAIGANTGFPQAYMHNNAYATPYQTPISQNVLMGSGDVKVDPYTGEEQQNGGMNQPMGNTNLASGGSIRHYDIGGEIGGAINSIGNGVSSALGGVNNLLTNAGQGRVSLADEPQTMSWDDPRFQARMNAILNGKPVPQYASGGISSLGSYSDGGRMLKGPGDGMSDDIPAKIGGKQEARLADGEFVVPADVVSHLGNGSTDAGAKQLYSMMDKVRQARTGRKSQGRQIKPNKYMPA